jgi:hypothetical protein
MGRSKREKALGQTYDTLQGSMGDLQTPAFGKDEINSIVGDVGDTYAGASNIAAGQIGATIPETVSTGRGQGFNEYYTQALAPVIAQGQRDKASTKQWGTNLFGNLDNAAKQRLLASLGLKSNIADAMDDTTGWDDLFGLIKTGASSAGGIAELIKAL